MGEDVKDNIHCQFVGEEINYHSRLDVRFRNILVRLDDVTQDTHYLLVNYGIIDPPLMQWRPYGKRSKKAAAT